MLDFLKTLFSDGEFMPHGCCYLWLPGVLWLNITSDALIALAYYSIPFTLVYFARKRRDIPFNAIFLCFAVFIIACGTTHLMEIWVIWHPTYWLSGSIKAITALVSIPTAILLVKLMPQALIIPSPTTLKIANAELEREISERKRAEDEVRRLNAELEQRVSERTRELETANKTLIQEALERQRAEQSSRDKQKLLQAIIDNTAAVIYVKDRQGRFMLVNRSFCELFHVVPESAIGKTDYDFLPRETAETVRAMDQRVAASNGALTEEETVTLEDGAHTYLSVKAPLQDDAGNLYAIFGISTDITESKQAGEKVRWLASFPEQNPNPILELDFATGEIHYQNPSAIRLFPELPARKLAHPYLTDLRETVGRLQDNATEVARREITVNNYHYSQTINYIPDSGRVRVYGTDISERKRAESKIQSLNAELEQRVARRTSELEAANMELESFSYSVSHDLRAPLRAINGFADIILQDYGSQLPEKGRHYLERVRNGGQQMGQLIDDLLAFARLNRQPVKRQEVETASLVKEVLEAADWRENGRVIEWRIGELPSCLGDQALLKQVWVNLISNAVKYTRGRNPAVVEIGCQHETGRDVYFVRDNGVGFDMQYAGKLFGVFQRLHRPDEFEGTGVGLAIVQRVVHRHGGRVWAEAALDQGAVFYFTIGKEIL